MSLMTLMIDAKMPELLMSLNWGHPGAAGLWPERREMRPGQGPGTRGRREGAGVWEQLTMEAAATVIDLIDLKKM